MNWENYIIVVKQTRNGLLQDNDEQPRNTTCMSLALGACLKWRARDWGVGAMTELHDAREHWRISKRRCSI